MRRLLRSHFMQGDMMKSVFKTLVVASAVAFAVHASAQVTFFEHEGFSGRQFTADRQIGNFERFGFNDSASSVIVRGGWWELCEDARFSGSCVTLRPGSYGSLAAIGLNNRVSSVRPAQAQYSQSDRGFYSPSGYDYRKRKDERLFEADVTSVRAVVGPPEQRCWVERQDVVTGSDNTIPGAIAGAVIGGILGHQVGSGRGRDVATGVGAVGGAVVGGNVARNYGSGQQVVSQDVQRCENVASSRPAYYDVTYNFRGTEHRVQTTSPPGRTIVVNRNGEPRV
jgi:uncharacterized protein YcfJ